MMQPGSVEPLLGHPRYRKVSILACDRRQLRCHSILTQRIVLVQIKDLNKGTFGFVQLAVDITNGLNYAIKFIERGDRV